MSYNITYSVAVKILESFLRDFHLPQELADKVFFHSTFGQMKDSVESRELKERIICNCCLSFLKNVSFILKNSE